MKINFEKNTGEPAHKSARLEPSRAEFGTARSAPEPSRAWPGLSQAEPGFVRLDLTFGNG